MTNPRLGLAGLLSNSTKVAAIVVSALLFQGCSSDMGPPPDQTAKNNPPVPAKEPTVKAPGGRGVLKVMDIKKRS
jgi:hypothetical protein